MAHPELTKKRIYLAFAVAIIADLLEFPITAAEDFTLGALFLPAEGVDIVLDCVVMGIMTKLLGFHWLFLPGFVIELIPEIDVLPTWVGCVAYVVAKRKKELPKPVQPPSTIDIHATEVTPATLNPPLELAPPLLPSASDKPTQSAVNEAALEKRLARLRELRAQSLISAEEYESKRQQILSEL